MKNLSGILTLLIFLSTLNIDASPRGELHEYDPGAPKGSLWPDLFAETPNYRLFGKKVIGGWGEKFRWHIGPMFYRGRLKPNSVKVFIVGQEGAQDENLSNRSFTGSTGTRMQKFLNYIGINKSYLFMNTFVYTITGQYSLYGEDRNDPKKVQENKNLLWLAQNPESIIVKHRHKMFDYMLETNKDQLKIIIGVGTAGKESVVTWLNSHKKGSCSYRKLTSSYCNGEGKLGGIIAIGLRHPGAASARNAGRGASGGLISDFKKKAKILANKINEDPNFLPEDKNITRDFSKEFKYGYAPIPHNDFAFGTPWVLGAGPTTSNRRGKSSIQIFSKEGCYNNGSRIGGRCQTIPPNESPAASSPDPRVHYLYFKNPTQTWSSSVRPSTFSDLDLPFEPPRSPSHRREYDPGPGKYSKSLIDFYKTAIKYEDSFVQSKSFGHTGIYRGRFENISLLVLTDQYSFTDMFSGRALTGVVGQKLAPFLKNFGNENDYLILRSLPVNCIQNENSCGGIALKSDVISARNKLLKKVFKNNKIKIIFTLGENSKAILKTIPVSQAISIHLDHHNLNNKKLEELFNNIQTNLFLGNSLSLPKYTHTVSSEFIPRKDLPFHTRWWMGTSGDRASQAMEKVVERVQNGRITKYKIGKENGDYYKLYSPKWSNNWKSENHPLTDDERKSLELFNRNR